MKIQKAELAYKLNKVKGVVPRKASIPALQGVLVSDGYLIANNLEMAVKAKIGGTGGERFLIPERAFDLVSNLPDGEVEVTPSGSGTVTIKAEKINNKYQTPDPGAFPDPAAQEGGMELTIKAETLMDSMRRVSYAVPPFSAHTAMTAMCLQASGGQLNVVGMDGHVVAWDKVGCDGEFQLLVPKNAVERLKTLGLSGDLRIRHNKTMASFVTEEYEAYTRLADGPYYSYQAVFDGFQLHTVVSRQALLDAVTRANICTEERKPVRFDLDGWSLNISITESATDYHEAVDLQKEIGEPLSIGFDAKLVAETLKAFGCDNVGLSFRGPKMPMLIESEDSDFRALVLPVLIR